MVEQWDGVYVWKLLRSIYKYLALLIHPGVLVAHISDLEMRKR